MKPRVYIETTIPSYLTAWPSLQPVRAAHQQVTREWWAGRGAFDLYVSRGVVVECGKGDPTAAADRLAALSGIDLLDESDQATGLADDIARRLALPPAVSADALHIANAAVNGIQYLLTWNCTHIANAAHRQRIEAACRAAGCEPPVICTPLELLPTGGRS